MPPSPAVDFWVTLSTLTVELLPWAKAPEANATGGKYYKPEDAGKLGTDISYSEAGINIRETRDLWDMPILFFLLIALRGGEWLLRRKWGVI